MRYRILLTDAVHDDLREIKYHFNQILKSPDTGKTLLQKIKEGMKSLSHMPQRHTISDPELASMGIRAFPVNNYIIFYVISKKEVTVFRVIHGSRNWVELIGSNETHAES